MSDKKTNVAAFIITGLVAVLVGFGIVVALQPAEYNVSRSITINATPAKIFPHINNLHNWQAWSPWVELDPKAQITFDGPEEGEGSSMTWDGNDQMGKGTMTITESKQDLLIKYRLDFFKPFEDTSMSEFVFLETAPEVTNLSWTMTGTHQHFLKKAMWMLFCSKIIGKNFDKGLTSLKSIVEKT